MHVQFIANILSYYVLYVIVQMCVLLVFQGSVRERACAPGSYQPSEGQHRCEVCPSGFYCLEEGKQIYLINFSFNRFFIDALIK